MSKENFFSSEDFQKEKKIGDLHSIIRRANQTNRRKYQEAIRNLKTRKEPQEIIIPSDSKKYFENTSKKTLSTLDITFYSNLLNSCTSLEELPDYLPKRINPNFEEIMNRLIVNLLKEIKEFNEFLATSSLELEERQAFEKEKDEKRILMESLIAFRDKVDVVEEEKEEERKNTIIYLQSPSGNYYVDSDEKKIEIEYYKSFWGLLESIQNGTFKNVRFFSANNLLNGLVEVKDFKTRIVFQRIERDVHCILAVFMKKVDVDAYYKEYLATRFSRYKQTLEVIKKSLKDERYLEKNNNITLSLQSKWGGENYGSH